MLSENKVGSGLYQLYDTTDFAIVRDMMQSSIYLDDSKFLACYGIQMTQTTAQIVPFDPLL